MCGKKNGGKQDIRKSIMKIKEIKKGVVLKYMYIFKRIIEGGKELLRLLQRGQVEQIAWDCVQLGFEYLYGWRLNNLSGQSL